jgi:cytochrome c-type biogenesis protein CcmH
MKSTSAPLDSLKDRLAQVDKLIAEGVLTGAAAKRARDELEAQVLALVTGAAVGSRPSPAAAAAANAPRPSRRMLLGATLFVLVFGAGGYALLADHSGWGVGPGETGEATAQGGIAHSTEGAQIDAMIATLAARLKDKPDDPEGWAMLGRSYTARGRFAEALPAYKRAFELRPDDAQVLADYADGLAMVNNRSLDGEPEKLVMKAVKIDPTNVKALALAGTIAFNHSEYKSAIDYWERAVKSGGPESDLSRQLQGAIDEARQRAGLPPVAQAASGVAPAAGETRSTGAMANASVSGRLTLAAGLKGQISPDDTVFVYARAPTGSRMPLAILRKKVSDLPLDFSLDDSMSMSPTANLSSTPKVVVGARISKTGNAIASPGDFEVLSGPVAVGTRDLKLQIAEPVR